MKKTIKILSLLLIVLFMFSSICFATANNTVDNNNAKEGNDHVEASFSVLNNDLYVADDDLKIDNYISGNVFAFGSTVTITGQIDGDLFVMADNLVIESTAIISNNVFALAKQMNVKGTVMDIYALTSNFTLESTGYINRDLKLYSPNTTIEGIIRKDAYIATNAISIPENSKDLIGGNLYYTSPEKSNIPEEAVTGQIKFEQMVENTSTPAEIALSYVTKFINTIVLGIAFILLAVFITPKFADKVTYSMKNRPFASCGIGILALFLTPVIAFFMLITGYLSYLAIALAVLYGLLISITLPIFGIAIGNYFADKFKEKSKGKVIGLSIASIAIIWILKQVPYIGSYVSIFTLVFGLGIFITSFFKQKQVEKN